jgi:hypothetical protein
MANRIETAINELPEAISSCQTCCHFVEGGTLLVNADDPADVIEAASSHASRSVGRWDSPITRSRTSSR